MDVKWSDTFQFDENEAFTINPGTNKQRQYFFFLFSLKWFSVTDQTLAEFTEELALKFEKRNIQKLEVFSFNFKE